LKNELLDLQGFTELLLIKSGLNLTDLSNALGITRVTLHNWRGGITNKISYGVIKKVGTAIDKNKWGFRLSGFHGNKIEVVYNKLELDNKNNITDNIDREELKEIIIDQAKEIRLLKEKLSGYGL